MTQHELRVDISLFRRLVKPYDRRGIVLRHTLACVVQFPEDKLRLGVSILGERSDEFISLREASVFVSRLSPSKYGIVGRIFKPIHEGNIAMQ